MKLASKILSPLAYLFYPHICAGCGSDLLKHPNLLCLQCILELPHTGYSDQENNPVEKMFWGRIPIVAGMSEFYFSKGTIVQSLIHQLKYKGNKVVGLMLGKMMGQSIINSNRFGDIDGLIPLPLTIKKEHQRGYNQSKVLCDGISDAIHIPVINGIVIRTTSATTQTKKRRSERWENVEGSFSIVNPGVLMGKHLLLVDDVITTGATLEACGKVILQVPDTRISIATLAWATR